MAKLNYENRSQIEKGYRGELFNRVEFNNQLNLGKEKNKITYLDVPYQEKDLAKAHGAKWDAEKKKWYCVGDSEIFKRWLGEPLGSDSGMKLSSYVREKHPTINALTKYEAKLLYIDYPLKSGWFKTYMNVEIPMEIVKKMREAAKINPAKKPARKKYKTPFKPAKSNSLWKPNRAG